MKKNTNRPNEPITHVLSRWSLFFEKIATEHSRWEMFSQHTPFRVGDKVILHETNAGGHFTGRAPLNLIITAVAPALVASDYTWIQIQKMEV